MLNAPESFCACTKGVCANIEDTPCLRLAEVFNLSLNCSEIKYNGDLDLRSGSRGETDGCRQYCSERGRSVREHRVLELERRQAQVQLEERRQRQRELRLGLGSPPGVSLVRGRRVLHNRILLLTRLIYAIRQAYARSRGCVPAY